MATDPLCQMDVDEHTAAGCEHVRRHFLLPRLVRDELRLIRQLIG